MVQSRRVQVGIFLFAALGQVGLAFALSSIHGPAIDGPDIPHLDKMLHFGEYFLIGLWVTGAAWAYPAGLRGRTHRAVAAWLPFCVAVVVGNLDELYQSTVPGRIRSFSDLVADVGGASAAGLLFFVWARRRVSKKRRDQ